MAGPRRRVGGGRLARARLPARPARHRAAPVRHRRALRDHRPLAERAARLRRADLPRPPGVRRHRRVHRRPTWSPSRASRSGSASSPRPRSAAAQALVLGGVSLRITGLYFALVTLSYGLVAEQNIFQIQELTGGGPGQRAPKPDWFDTDWRYYYLCLGVPRRRALHRLADDAHEGRAGAAGPAREPAGRRRRSASTCGSPRCSRSSSRARSPASPARCSPTATTSVSPEHAGTSTSSLVFVIMTVVGGLRSRAGVVIGAAFFALLPLPAREVPRSSRICSPRSPVRPT